VALDPDEIDRLIRQGLPDCDVTISDLRGDGRQYAATIVSPHFSGYSRVEQHRIVHALLRDKVDDLESLVIHTALPS
jgi:stress-induced morphogen